MQRIAKGLQSQSQLVVIQKLLDEFGCSALYLLLADTRGKGFAHQQKGVGEKSLNAFPQPEQ